MTGSVTTRKAERLMNLVICLLVTRGYVSKDRIRKVVDGYRDQSPDAFEKMFERDKEELREIGIPIEVGSHEALFDDEPGYRIRRGAFELPEITLEPDEAAVVGLAARVWQHAGLARQTTDALVKLRAGGVAVDREALSLVEPRLAASEPAFEPLCDAVVTRTPVRFGYRRPGLEAAERTWSPGVCCRGGGAGTSSAATATARHRACSGSRGSPRRCARPGVPGPTACRKAPTCASWLAACSPHPRRDRQACVCVPAPATPCAGVPAPYEPRAEGWDRLDLPLTHVDELAEEVVAYGADVVAVDPPELAAAVVARLRRLACLGAEAAP